MSGSSERRALDDVFVAEDGETRTWENILRTKRYEPNIVETTEDGFIVAETEYKRNQEND